MKTDKQGAATGETANGDVGEIQTLELESVRIIRRIDAIPQEMAATEAKILEAKATLASVDRLVEEKRLERQRLLADGQEVGAITRDIGTIRAEKELAEDAIAGLGAKVETLRTEGSRLSVEDLPLIQNEIARRKVAPLVTQYNERAAKLAEVTEAIFEMMVAYRQPLSEFSGFLRASSWDSFASVPRLSLEGKKTEDFFNVASFSERLRRAREAKPREETPG